MREFRTSTDNGWAYGCDIGRMKAGTAIRVTYHATRTGNLIVTHWDDGRSTGTSLATELDALIEAAQLRVAVTPAQISHQPVRL